jgi:hypothetical protein
MSEKSSVNTGAVVEKIDETVNDEQSVLENTTVVEQQAGPEVEVAAAAGNSAPSPDGEVVLVIKFINTITGTTNKLSIQIGDNTPPTEIELSTIDAAKAPLAITNALTTALINPNVLDALMAAITTASKPAQPGAKGGAIQQSTSKNNTRKRY